MADIRGRTPLGRWAPVLIDDNGRVAVFGDESVIVNTAPVAVDGMAANGHADEDVVGLPITIDVPKEGIILSAIGVDTDDEEIEYNIFVFNKPFTASDDDAAFTLVAADIPNLVGIINVNSFVNINGDAVGTENNINMPYHTSTRKLYCQIVTTGTPNYALTTELWISFGIQARVR